jgi:pilus assembly protein CpaE
MEALQLADDVLLVTQLDLPCLRNVVRLMMSFGQQDHLAGKVKVLVNRVGLDSGQISLKKAQETIGAEIFWQLPNDYRVMVEVRNNGLPLIEQAPKAAITQSIISLVDALCGDQDGEVDLETADSATGSKRWLGIWPAKAKGR